MGALSDGKAATQMGFNATEHLPDAPGDYVHT